MVCFGRRRSRRTGLGIRCGTVRGYRVRFHISRRSRRSESGRIGNVARGGVELGIVSERSGDERERLGFCTSVVIDKVIRPVVALVPRSSLI
jgi:hypothetical protein